MKSTISGKKILLTKMYFINLDTDEYKSEGANLFYINNLSCTIKILYYSENISNIWDIFHIT